MARDVISGYIASLSKHNDPVPTEDFHSVLGTRD
jgi:hypothetical protein